MANMNTILLSNKNISKLYKLNYIVEVERVKNNSFYKYLTHRSNFLVRYYLFVLLFVSIIHYVFMLETFFVLYISSSFLLVSILLCLWNFFHPYRPSLLKRIDKKLLKEKIGTEDYFINVIIEHHSIDNDFIVEQFLSNYHAMKKRFALQNS